MDVDMRAPEAVQMQKTASVKKNGFSKGTRIALYIPLTVLLIIISVLMIVIISVKMFVTKDNISSLIHNTDYMTIMAADPDGYELTVYEILCSQLNCKNLERDSLYKIIEQAGIEDTAAEYIYSYVAFVLYGEDLDEINEKSVMKIYDKIIQKIEDNLNISYDEEDRNEAESTVKEQSELLDSISEYGIENTIGGGLGAIRFFFSIAGLIVLSAAVVSIIVLMAVTSRKAATPLCVAGSVFSVFGLIGTVISILSLTGHFIVDVGSLSAASIIFQSAVGIFAPVMLKFMGYVLTVGIIFILVGAIINTIFSKKRKA